jgi:flagellar biosynthetic protein FlhB
MSQERTEKATPKRREDARKKGQIARGPELPAALGFIAVLFTINTLKQNISQEIGHYIEKTALKVAMPQAFALGDVQDFFTEAVKVLMLIVVPIMTVALGAGLAGNFAQGGFSFSTEALTPKADKFNPVNNIKKVFGLDAVVNILKSSLKLLIIGGITYGVLYPAIESAPKLIHAPLPIVITSFGETIYSLALRCGLVLLVFAGADYGYSWYKNEKSLRMTKQEIRDEYKEQEGDPMVKQQRRRAARALLQKRSLGEVPSATVVITNPTHISIALRYDREKDAAPIVVAKGADNMAAKIREIAKENNIPLVENKPLARALYKVVEPNQIIPIEFFGAVAEILAFVFRQKHS